MMVRSALLVCLTLVLGVVLIHAAVIGTLDVAQLQAGVVRITATPSGEPQKVGTGFIVRIERDVVYIVTAAHVVSGDAQPKVQFFTQSDVSAQAIVKHSEGRDEVTGLALLVVRGKDNLPSGLTALTLTSAPRMSGNDEIILIGHPRGAGDWVILRGSIASRQGRYVIVDANIDEGNSGGPIIQNGEVVGIVGGVTRYGRGVTSGSVREYLEGHGINIQEAPAAVDKVQPTPSIPITPEKPVAVPDREIIGQDGAPMVRIPAGEFRMGSPDGKGNKEEHPVHEVRFTKPFAIARYETTFEAYDRFAQATGRTLPDDDGFGRGRRPVINVSWQEAKDYAAWLSGQTGKRYRLPTESEWEYAAGAGGTDEWSGTSAQEQLTAYAVYSANSQNRTAPVGSKKPNRLGLYDMSGNVWEWVEDCLHVNYKEAPKDGSAWGKAAGGDCGLRVIRGGSWNSLPGSLRASFRFWDYPVNRYYYTGFRLVQDID